MSLSDELQQIARDVGLLEPLAPERVRAALISLHRAVALAKSQETQIQRLAARAFWGSPHE